MTASKKIQATLMLSLLCGFFAFAQHGNGHEQPQQGEHTQTVEHQPAAAHHKGDAPYNAGETAIHHIADANAIHVVGDVYIHLPVILYAPSQGWTFTTTAAFHPHHHGNGTIAKDGYVLAHGNVLRVKAADFPKGEVEVGEAYAREIEVDGKKKEVFFLEQGGKEYELEKKTSWDGGLMGGGITGFYDFSITRNVFTMLLTCLVLFLVFRSVAAASVRRAGQAPTGLQNFIEPFVTFIRDEVAKPNIGPKYEKYMPYLLSAFFFILGLNLIGQLPFFPGSANVTGNISVTIVLALLTFLISTFSANKHFWEHTLWMPGVPAVLKVLILTPIEILGLFLKPFTLLLRLFANITAGHIVILSFVSLIFIFGGATEHGAGSVGGSAAGAAASIPLTLFMMTLELLVAFLQAFIFTMLSATYIGTAIEEPHHDHH
ncbi:MAG: F0F1 ATP synthase subunit A [Saprospiraceae bacterium]